MQKTDNLFGLIYLCDLITVLLCYAKSVTLYHSKNNVDISIFRNRHKRKQSARPRRQKINREVLQNLVRTGNIG